VSVSTYEDLLTHVGHEFECVTYGDGDNVALECLTCNVVIVDFTEGG
jgi:hypothetical protein